MDYRPRDLSSRELEVLRLKAEGLPAKQIADILGIKVPTVKNHLHNIHLALKVADTPEAVAVAFRKGWLK